MTSQRKTGTHPFYIGMYIHICTHIYVHIYTSQKECLHIFSRCLPLSPVVSLHVRGGCWLVWSASWALKWSCLPLSPIVSGCLPSCGGWVLVGVVGFLGSEVVLSPVVSHCLRVSPFMWGVGVGWCGRHLGL